MFQGIPKEIQILYTIAQSPNPENSVSELWYSSQNSNTMYQVLTKLLMRITSGLHKRSSRKENHKMGINHFQEQQKYQP